DPLYLNDQRVKTGQANSLVADQLLQALFVKNQENIAEMDSWTLKELSKQLGIHEGDSYPYIVKIDNSFGYNFDDVNNHPPTPYDQPGDTAAEVVAKIINNYQSASAQINQLK